MSWVNLTVTSLSTLFGGITAAVPTLTELISDGKFIEGGADGNKNIPPPDPTGSLIDLENTAATSFFDFTIPALWNFSSTYDFVTDSGASCDTSYPVSDYMSNDDMDASGYCYNNNLYYLVYPHQSPDGEDCTTEMDGDQTIQICTWEYLFAPAPGFDSLDGTFGGVTLADLIIGAVNIYVFNGNANSGPIANPANSGSLEQLYNQNNTAPGYVTIPVFSPDKAQRSINANQNNVLLYPCNQ